MSQSPFLDDPRDALRRQIAAAMDSPLEQARAMHLDLAEHLAGIARESGLSHVEERSLDIGVTRDRAAGWKRIMQAFGRRVADWSRRGSIDGEA